MRQTQIKMEVGEGLRERKEETEVDVKEEKLEEEDM